MTMKEKRGPHGNGGVSGNVNREKGDCNWWIDIFVRHPTKHRVKFLLQRGRPDDIHKLLEWIAHHYEGVIRYPPCAEVNSPEALLRVLNQHGVPAKVCFVVEQISPLTEDPHTLGLSDLFSWLDGFGDMLIVFGSREKPALLIKPEMSTPLVFLPKCRHGKQKPQKF